MRRVAQGFNAILPLASGEVLIRNGGVGEQKMPPRREYTRYFG